MTSTGALIGSVGMSNALSEEKKQQLIALGKLGWSLRKIERETGVRHETAGAYLTGELLASMENFLCSVLMFRKEPFSVG